MNLSARKTLQKGFTLIELLVVIGILGILAAALVATIDPFEQLKKGDDAKIKNMAVEFQTSLIRYYTTHGAFPWNDPGNSDTACTDLATSGIDPVALNDAGMTSCITNSLVAEGELKSAFTTNTADLAKVQVNWDSGDGSNVAICFAPTSKSQKASPETIYDETGADNTGAPDSCPDASAADGTCYWCTR